MKCSSLLKKYSVCIIFAILCFASIGVSAKTVKIQYQVKGTYKNYTGKTYNVYYNNKLISSSTKAPALRLEDNYMIPVKWTLASRGPKLKYAYSSKNQDITVTMNGKKAKLSLKNRNMYVNGKKQVNDIAAVRVKIDGVCHIYAPAKAFYKAFGFGYKTNKTKKKVWFTTPSSSKAASTTAAKATTTETKPATTTESKPVTVVAKTEPVVNTSLKATAFMNMKTSEFIKIMGPICQKSYKETGILASVTLAQAINESGWGKTSLAQKSNNLFGMKTNLSGNTWSGSAWDGKSYVSITTTEEYGGKKVAIVANFRKYSDVYHSVLDHAAYLKNAMNGSKKRYAGITSTKSYTKQLEIIRNGGYCTWSSYYSELKSIIEKYNLTQYDK